MCTLVGGPVSLGTLLKFNWGISFSFILWGMDPSPPPLLSVSFSLSSHNLSAVPLLPLNLSSSLSWFASVLHFFSDLSMGEWQQDSSSGNTNRVLSYTIALNNPLGPKTASVVDTQVRLWQMLTVCCCLPYLVFFLHTDLVDSQRKVCAFSVSVFSKVV